MPVPASVEHAPAAVHALKALLFDLESAVPVESVRRRDERMRHKWIDRVKVTPSVPRYVRKQRQRGRWQAAGSMRLPYPLIVGQRCNFCACSG